MSLARPDHITFNQAGFTCRRCSGHLAITLPLAEGELVQAIDEHVRPFIEAHAACRPTFTVSARAA